MLLERALFRPRILTSESTFLHGNVRTTVVGYRAHRVVVKRGVNGRANVNGVNELFNISQFKNPPGFQLYGG